MSRAAASRTRLESLRPQAQPSNVTSGSAALSRLTLSTGPTAVPQSRDALSTTNESHVSHRHGTAWSAERRAAAAPAQRPKQPVVNDEVIRHDTMQLRTHAVARARGTVSHILLCIRRRTTIHAQHTTPPPLPDRSRQGEHTPGKLSPHFGSHTAPPTHIITYHVPCLPASTRRTMRTRPYTHTKGACATSRLRTAHQELLRDQLGLRPKPTGADGTPGRHRNAVRAASCAGKVAAFVPWPVTCASTRPAATVDLPAN